MMFEYSRCARRWSILGFVCLSAGCNPPTDPADTIYLNGEIVTVDDSLVVRRNIDRNTGRMQRIR